MENVKRQADDGARDMRVAALMDRLGVKTPLMKVSDLARLTGLTQAGIRTQMRAGRFPMPHRRIGSAILVRFDDFFDWFESEPAAGALASPDATASERAEAAAAHGLGSAEPEPIRRRPPILATPETPKQRAVRMHELTLEAMRRTREREGR